MAPRDDTRPLGLAQHRPCREYSISPPGDSMHFLPPISTNSIQMNLGSIFHCYLWSCLFVLPLSAAFQTKNIAQIRPPKSEPLCHTHTRGAIVNGDAGPHNLCDCRGGIEFYCVMQYVAIALGRVHYSLRSTPWHPRRCRCSLCAGPLGHARFPFRANHVEVLHSPTSHQIAFNFSFACPSADCHCMQPSLPLLLRKPP